MSFQRATGPILATVCGVCTAYAAFAPELQKQQEERVFKEQHHVDSPPLTKNELQNQAEAQPPHHTIISNDESIGASVKEAVHQAKTEVAPKKAWWGLSMFSGALGGGDSQDRKADNEKKP